MKKLTIGAYITTAVLIFLLLEFILQINIIYTVIISILAGFIFALLSKELDESKFMMVVGIIAGVIIVVFISNSIFNFSTYRGFDRYDEKDRARGRLDETKESNLAIKEEQEGGDRDPCDEFAIQRFVIDNYPEGTHVLEYEKRTTFDVPDPAIIYYNAKNRKRYVFTVIAKSKEGERLIEKDNVTGYASSFINLDSTKLGTAFFYLTMFECRNDSIIKRWETEVPTHGGFSSIKMKKWNYREIPYVEVRVIDGIISGHRNYNFFAVEGFEEPPHLMETYLGLTHKRKLMNYDDDIYPDYLEYWFLEDSVRIRLFDSIPFYWDTTKNLYVTNRTKRWFRKY